MSTQALQGLLNYLKETLSFDNRKWLAEHLVNPSEDTFPKLTMEEINARIDQSERDVEEGRVYTNDEMVSFMNNYLKELKETI